MSTAIGPWKIGKEARKPGVLVRGYVQCFENPLPQPELRPSQSNGDTRRIREVEGRFNWTDSHAPAASLARPIKILQSRLPVSGRTGSRRAVPTISYLSIT